MKEDNIPLRGVILEILKGDNFRIKTENHEAICKPSGKIRKHHINLIPGDKVDIEVSPYDLTRGRIIYRIKE